MSEREEQYGHTLQEVYEQFKHLDHLLSDREWLGERTIDQVLYDLWQAVKASATHPPRIMLSLPDDDPRVARVVWREQEKDEIRLWIIVEEPEPSEQPLPSPGSEPVTPRLRELLPRLIDEREREGIETYGESLETWNGRDVHRDLREELVDALQYNEQAAMERADLVRWLREALALAEDAIGELPMTSWGDDMKVRLAALQEKAAKALPPTPKFDSLASQEAEF